jgi:hypothetical protein
VTVVKWSARAISVGMHTHQYDEYVEGHEDDEIYQEEIEVDHKFHGIW